MEDPGMEPPEVIEAGGVTLRRWDPAWAEQLQEAIRASLPELQPFMPWATDDHGLAESRGYIDRSVSEWSSGENWNYAICTTDEEIIGSCGLMSRMGPGVLEIGYWVHSAHAGRGHASAAAMALTEVGLQVPGVERIAIKHDVANPASGRVAAKSGFTRVDRVPTEARAPGQTGVELVWERRS